MELKDIVMKMIGNVEPIGSTDVDEERFENLKQLCDLTEKLIYEIEKVAVNNKDMPEYSMSKTSKYAMNTLHNKFGIDECF